MEAVYKDYAKQTLNISTSSPCLRSEIKCDIKRSDLRAQGQWSLPPYFITFLHTFKCLHSCMCVRVCESWESVTGGGCTA